MSPTTCPDDPTDEMPHILFVTFDGLLQHLGHSQVVRYLKRLSERGLDYTILSLERPSDLADTPRVTGLQQDLEAADIDWVFEQYDTGGGLSSALDNLATATSRALKLTRQRSVQLIHARSYLGATVAHLVERATDVPYLFDIRGYWIDERRRDGRWFTNPVALSAGRFVERRLYENAAGIVALTEESAADIKAGRFGDWEGSRPVTVIPTCADYEDFAGRSGDDRAEVVEQLADTDELVLGYVGSIKSAYYVEECLRLFERVRHRRSDAHLVCATSQIDEFHRRLLARNIPTSATTVCSVPHEQMPDLLEAIDWGYLLVEESFTRRAMMPTKLAEFFAAGVRPIYYGCNADVRRWVKNAGSGIVLDEISTEQLDRAADQIAQAGADDRVVDRARTITRPYFDIEAGIDLYEELSRYLAADTADSAEAFNH